MHGNLEAPFLHISRELDLILDAAFSTDLDHTIHLQQMLNAITTRLYQHLEREGARLSIPSTHGIMYSDHQIQLVLTNARFKHHIDLQEVIEALMYSDEQKTRIRTGFRETLLRIENTNAFLLQLLGDQDVINQELMRIAYDTAETVQMSIDTGLSPEETYPLVIQERVRNTGQAHAYTSSKGNVTTIVPNHTISA